MQTEPDEDDDWFKPPTGPLPPKRHYMSLSKQLLLRSQQDRARQDERRKLSMSNTDGTQSDGQHLPGTENADPAQAQSDTEMPEVKAVQAPASMHTSISEPSAHNPRPPDDDTNPADIKPPPPWPAAEQSRPLNGFRQNNLHVQMPTKPSLHSDIASNSPLVETPTSAMPQSPFPQHPTTFPPSFSHSSSSLVQPSPIKKKISLGEYFNQRKGSQPTTEITTVSPQLQQAAFKAAGESKDIAMHGSAIVDTPKHEESDPMAVAESKDPKL